MDTLQIAKVCYEVHRAYCLALGDYSQPAWEDAPERQQNSAIAKVKYHLENLHSGPSDSHQEWLRVKLNDGWKYGPVKNSETQEHPDIVPFRSLPIGEQAKNLFFRAIVRQLSK